MLEINLVHILIVGIVVDLVVLVYTYVVFPLTMAAIGVTHRPRVQRPAELPPVSLIIPAHNEEQVIVQKLVNSQSLDYPNLEIVLASDGSHDKTVELASRFDGIRVLAFEHRRGKSCTMSDAVEEATHEILCLCDANVMIRPDAIWRLVTHLGDNSVGGVTGDVRLKSNETSFGFAEKLYYRIERCIHRGESRLGSVIGVDGGMYVVRRDLFRKLAADTVLDDFTVSMQVLRSGKKLLYEPTAVADENATELAMDEYRRRVRIGVGAAQVLRRGMIPRFSQPIRLWLFVSHKLLRWLSPWLLLTLLTAASALAFHRWEAFIILVPGILTLGLAIAGAVWPGLRKHRVITVPFYFVLSEIAFGWGTIRGLLFNSTGIWQRTNRRPLEDQQEVS